MRVSRCVCHAACVMMCAWVSITFSGVGCVWCLAVSSCLHPLVHPVRSMNRGGHDVMSMKRSQSHSLLQYVHTHIIHVTMTHPTQHPACTRRSGVDVSHSCDAPADRHTVWDCHAVWTSWELTALLSAWACAVHADDSSDGWTHCSLTDPLNPNTRTLRPHCSPMHRPPPTL